MPQHLLSGFAGMNQLPVSHGLSTIMASYEAIQGGLRALLPGLEAKAMYPCLLPLRVHWTLRLLLKFLLNL